MPRFKTFLDWIGLGSTEADFDSWIARQPAPAITFPELKDVASPPPNEAVQQNVFYRVMRNDQPKWALFQCPCGCRSVVTLSLQSAHRPHWVVRTSKKYRPSMRPSVWRDIGCFSHFWVEDGRVYWCGDTGSSPRQQQLTG
jgi:hypothetical protein